MMVQNKSNGLPGNEWEAGDTLVQCHTLIIHMKTFDAKCGR